MKDAFDEQEKRETESILEPEKRCVDCEHLNEATMNEPCISCLPRDDRPGFKYRVRM